MNNNTKIFFFIFLCSASYSLFAGKWINWGTIAHDVKEGITSAIDFVSEKLSTHATTVTESGTVVTKEMSISAIEKVELFGTGNLIISQNDKQSESLIIEADEAIMPYIETQISNKTLSLKIQDNISYQTKNRSLVYRINLKKLTHLSLSGATRSELNTIKADALTIDLQGASRLLGTVDIQSLAIDASGASKITLTGKAIAQNIDLSGSSSCDAQNLAGKAIIVHITGSSVVYCNPSETLSGKVSGASSLYYTNKPTVSVKSTGVASIQKI